MATHSSILAWRIPWTEEAGGLQFMGSQRVGHDSDGARMHARTVFNQALSHPWTALLPSHSLILNILKRLREWGATSKHCRGDKA